MTFDPVISLLEIYPIEIHAHMHKDVGKGHSLPQGKRNKLETF